jgi:hypothetical protein
MTPLILAGATSVANYLASKSQSGLASSPSSLRPAIGAESFDAVLRGVQRAPGRVISGEARGQNFERQLLSAPEVKEALRACGHSAVIKINQEGDVFLESVGGRKVVAISEGSRELARQVFLAKAGRSAEIAQVAGSEVHLQVSNA